MTMHQDKFNGPKQAIKVGLEVRGEDSGLAPYSGSFLLEMTDSRSGDVLLSLEKKNIITLDGGLAAAAHFKGTLSGGIKMLAIGSGATGNLLSPDAPVRTQRKLNNELSRKAFASSTFRTSEGVAVSYVTNIVDFTTTFGESEAVGALNEMGLMIPYSSNPSTRNPINNGPNNYDSSIDTQGLDILVNYTTFGVIVKPATAVVAVTWRLTF